jgi:hypothetical protein
MWRKCGTKISNEINEIKKSVVFFGSDIYPNYQISLVLSGDQLRQQPSPAQAVDLRL